MEGGETGSAPEMTMTTTVMGQRQEREGEGMVCYPAPASIRSRFTHPPGAVFLSTHHNDLARAERQLIFPVSIAVTESADPAEQQSALQADESILRPPQLPQTQTKLALVP